MSHVLSDYLYAMLLSWNCRNCLSSYDVVSDMGKFCQMYTKTYITRYLFFYIYTYLIPLYDRSYFALDQNVLWQARIQFIINLRYIKVCKRCTNICILLINWDPLNLSLTFFFKVIVINLKLTILSDIVQSQAPNSVQLCLFIA